MNATGADPDVDVLLDDADRGRWPANDDAAAWTSLRNWCFQEECRLADENEASEWLAAIGAVQSRHLPHDQFVDTRGEMLRERIRARKLVQSRLRWKYGWKTGRRAGLIRRDVRAFYDSWAGE